LEARSTEFHADLFVGPNLTFIDPNILGLDTEFPLIGLWIRWRVKGDTATELALGDRRWMPERPVKGRLELNLCTLRAIDKDGSLLLALALLIDDDRQRAETPSRVA
jgi:hypothetical protein